MNTTALNTSRSPLLDAPLKRLLVSSTIPVIWGTLLLLGFGLVDTFFVSLLGDRPLAAISFTFPVTFTVISLNIGIGIGAAATVAKLVGAGERQQSRIYGTSAILLGLIITISAVTTIAVFKRSIFSYLGVDDDLWPLVDAYMTPWLFSGVLLSVPMVCNSVFRANGDTRSPSKIMALGGLINVVLDPVLIFGIGDIQGLGIAGAAVATVISWLICSALALYMVAVKKQWIAVSQLNYKTIYLSSKKILSIALPACFANMLTPLANGVLMAIIASYGYEAVAAWGVGGRVEAIMTVVLLSLSMSLPPVIAQNYGAKQYQRVITSHRIAVTFVLAWQIAMYFIGLIMIPLVTAAFTDDPQVASVLTLYMMIIPIGFGFQGVVILTNSAFNALHKPLWAMLLNIIRLFVLVVPFAFVGSKIGNIEGLFVGVVIGYVVAALISVISFYRQTTRFSLCD